MKKYTILTALLFLTLVSTQLNAQGDYKNNLLSYTMSSSSSIKPADFTTMNSEVVITGKFPPLTNSIPNVSNQQNAERIFLTDFVTGTTTFNLAYLLVGLDNSNINPDFRYEVKEVKPDNDGFVVCGQLTCNSSSYGTFSEAFVLKTNNLGAYQWFYRYKVSTAKSTFFNSIEPIVNNGQPQGYVACGYIFDSANIKRAVVFQLDTVGKVNGGVKVLWESAIGGLNQESEYNKVIRYDGDYYALVGYSGFIPDGCGKGYQSNVLFSMWDVSNSSIIGNIYRTNSMNQFNGHVDKGISLVLIDSGLVILCDYFDNNGLLCSDMPDIVGHLLWIYPSAPNNNSTWYQIKDLKYNPDANLSSIDYPRDILYDVSSGSSRHLWLYNNHTLNTGSILKVDLNANTNLIPPMELDNNSGFSQINGKAIAFNSLGNTIGLTQLFTSRYSIFEVSASSSSNCKSDSIQVNFYLDTLSEDSVLHYTFTGDEKKMDHKAHSIPVGLSLECDSVSSKPIAVGENVQGSYLVSVYPNPVSDIIKIRVSESVNENIIIKITDMSGKTLISKVYKKGTNPEIIEMDLSKVQIGCYFLYVYCASESSRHFVIKE